MERFNGLLILTTVLLLPWFRPLNCRAQPPAAPAPAAQGEAARQDLPQPQPVVTPPAPTLGVIQVPSDLLTPPSQKSPLELPPPPGGETVTQLSPPPMQPGDRPLPINLAAALRLADARPIIIAEAQARAWIAEGQLQRAKAIWIPQFMMNAAYLRHDGPVDFTGGVNIPQGINALGQPDPGSFGKPLNQNLNWFISGFSLYEVIATTDAIFSPLAARQDLNAKRWDIQTAKNDSLLDTARAYFNVHRFRGRYSGSIYCVEQGRRLIEKINALKSDLIPAVEVDRARNLLAFLEEKAVTDRENWRIASADLTQVLRLDPRAVVQPLENDHLQITFVDPSRSLDDLIPIGLSNRPELASQQAAIQAAMVRVRQEKMRPLIPSILITGFQTPGGMTTEAAIFGTGNGGKLNLWSFRDDISTQMVWQIENMGLGNAALIKRRRGQQSQATAQLFHLQDKVASEITQAQANLQGAAARVVQAERSLRTSLVTFQRNLEGLGQTKRFENVLDLVYRPQEVVYALKLLNMTFDEYFDTVADYNTTQFELFHALGYPARELEFLRPAGDILPVDTTRPGVLPPVGIGPPPSTR